jgi:hypothetical protein
MMDFEIKRVQGLFFKKVQIGNVSVVMCELK